MPYAHGGPEWVEITGDPASRVLPAVGPGGDDVSVPNGWAEAQDEAALEAFGVKEIGEPDPPPAGYRATGSTLVDDDGAPVRAWVLEEIPIEELIAGKIAAVNAWRDAAIDGGLPHDGHVFQSRPSDRENIVALGFDAVEAIRNGAEPGDYLWHPDFPDGFAFITADNQTLPMDAFQMRDMRAAGTRFKGALTFAGRAKKDWLLDPARTRAEVLAFDPAGDIPD